MKEWKELDDGHKLDDNLSSLPSSQAFSFSFIAFPSVYTTIHTVIQAGALITSIPLPLT